MAEDAPKSSTAPEKPAGSPPITPPGAQTVGNTDLKIVHTSPERPPKQKSQHADESQMSREELLEQAQKFLESAPIKNAPLKEKLEFLHTKGLTREETEALLAKLKEKEDIPTAEEKGKGKETVKTEPTPKEKQSPAKPTPAPVAPIVTYPEFLTPAPPPPPPPLLTAKSLAKTLYFASGAAATIYGANKFVFTPMYDALTLARLDLSSTALTNLTELNTRLRALVPNPRAPASDSDSDSDPGELFHVDATTQTFESFEHDGDEPGAEGALERLGRQLETLVESHSDGTDNELTFALEDLTGYLEGLTYESQGMGLYSSPYGGYGGMGGGKEKGGDDMVMKVKAEIRSVKGVLLNSKNFPASR